MEHDDDQRISSHQQCQPEQQAAFWSVENNAKMPPAFCTFCQRMYGFRLIWTDTKKIGIIFAHNFQTGCWISHHSQTFHVKTKKKQCFSIDRSGWKRKYFRRFRQSPVGSGNSRETHSRPSSIFHWTNHYRDSRIGSKSESTSWTRSVQVERNRMDWRSSFRGVEPAQLIH